MVCFLVIVRTCAIFRVRENAMTIGVDLYDAILHSDCTVHFSGEHGIKCLYKCLQLGMDIQMVVYPKDVGSCLCLEARIPEAVGNHEVITVDISRTGENNKLISGGLCI